MDHVATVCPNLARYLRCCWEGHQAGACKRPRSSDSSGPLAVRRLGSMVAVLHPCPRDISLAERRPAASSGHSGGCLGSSRGGGEAGRRGSDTSPGGSPTSTRRAPLPTVHCPLPPPPCCHRGPLAGDPSSR
jgi:hypothetical protein